MRIAVFGAGGVGGYIGAHLCGKSDEVTIVARGTHLEAMRQNGLKVVEDAETYTVFPDVIADEQGINGVYDLVILAVKGYDMSHALSALRPHLNAHSILLPLANGVDHFDRLAASLDATVLTGCCYILSHLESPGIVRKKGKVFAAVFGSAAHPEAVQRTAEVFDKAGLRSKTTEEIDAAVWKKYLFISAFASMTSYYDMPIKTVYDTHGEEVTKLLEEIAAVARAKGIEIGDEVQKALDTAAGLPPDASTSMHLDFQQGKPTELESLSGYIVSEGKRLGMATPVMAKLYEGLNAGKD